MGEEERGPYLTLGESAEAWAQDAGQAESDRRDQAMLALEGELQARADEIERLRAALREIEGYDPERDGVWGPRELARRALRLVPRERQPGTS